MAIILKPILFKTEMVKAILEDQKTQTRRVCKYQGNLNPKWTGKRWCESGNDDTFHFDLKCKYQKGMELWVKETFRHAEEYGEYDGYIYKADLSDKVNQKFNFKWKPSIFMPRIASRITLIVENVRIEQVQEISDLDILNEGIKKSPVAGLTLREKWIFLWDSIHVQPKPKKNNKIITHYESYPWSEDTADKRKEINGKPHYCYPNPWLSRIVFEVKKRF